MKNLNNSSIGELKLNNSNNIALNNAVEEISELKANIYKELKEHKQLIKNSKKKTFISWLCYYVFYSLLKNFTANLFRTHEIDIYSIITKIANNLFVHSKELFIKLGGKINV